MECLSSLQELIIEFNELEKLPYWLYELRDLVVLRAWGNKLNNKSESIGNLTKLRYLDLQ